ncbi:MAG: Holliday junction resolvase Hjc [Candidatus Woesearchaeota archaeon]|nr:Holliday junction resolvase Hjc [Candidatus Woesearchaeota archaeon]
MNTSAKGTRAERELLHLFWKTERFVVMRAPASGAIKYPCPDLLVGNHERKLAIECKSPGVPTQYFTGKEIADLRSFSTIFGAEPWVAIRFSPGLKPEWYFVSIEDLNPTDGGNFVVTLAAAQRKGLLFDEIIKK